MVKTLLATLAMITVTVTKNFSMAGEVAGARVKEAIDSMLDTLDRTCLRQMQGDMHRCAAKCCSNSALSMSDVHRCIESCSKDITGAQTFLQNELNNYQDRIQRCVLQCQDEVKDKITASTSDTQIANYKKEFEQCVVGCADTHIKLIPSMLKRITEVLKGGNSNLNLT